MEESINRQTLSEQIYTVLRNDILTQKIPCGTKLRLQMLRARFGVSHTPIRDALTRLAEDELVTYYSNVGVRVVELTVDDARELFQLIGDLDSLALKYACTGESCGALIEELGDIIHRSDKAIAEGDLAAWQRYSDEFHLVFYKHANNSRLTAASKKLLAQMTLLINTYQQLGANLELVNSDHKRIYESVCAGDIAKATEQMHQHMNDNMLRAVKAMSQ